MGKILQGLFTIKRKWRVSGKLRSIDKEQLLKALHSIEDRLQVLEFCELVSKESRDQFFKDEIVRHRGIIARYVGERPREHYHSDSPA